MTDSRRYTIQRGLDEESHPNSYEEKGYLSLKAAVKRVAELKRLDPTSNFRIVEEKSWSKEKMKWMKTFDEKGARIDG